MAYKLQVTDRAESNIDGVLAYMRDTLKSPGAAKSFLRNVKKEYRTITGNPYIYALCAEEVLARKGYRRAVLRNYLLFYRIFEETKTVSVVSVIHGSRNYTELL